MRCPLSYSATSASFWMQKKYLLSDDLAQTESPALFMTRHDPAPRLLRAATLAPHALAAHGATGDGETPGDAEAPGAGEVPGSGETPGDGEVPVVPLGEGDGDVPGVGDGEVPGVGDGDVPGVGDGELVVAAGSTLAANWPRKLPGGVYWHTKMVFRAGAPLMPLGQSLYAHPMLAEFFQTTCVKWPVPEVNPGFLKSYLSISLYHAATAGRR
jgi:hypothetical protein